MVVLREVGLHRILGALELDGRLRVLATADPDNFWKKLGGPNHSNLLHKNVRL